MWKNISNLQQVAMAPIAGLQNLTASTALGQSVSNSVIGQMATSSYQKAQGYWNQLSNPEVVRDTNNAIIGPKHQYVLSGLELNKKPFTPKTVGKVLAFGLFLFTMGKSGALSSPVDFVSALDDPLAYFDYGGVWTKPSCDIDAILDECYAPGGQYYQLAKQDPESAKLWSSVLGGLDRNQAHFLFSLFMIGLGIGMTAKEYRAMIEKTASDQNQVGPIGTMAWAGFWLGAYGMMRLMSDSAGMHQFTPNGNANILDNWGQWDLEFNLDLAAGYWAAAVVGAPLLARSARFGFNLTFAGYSTLGDWVHANPDQASLVRKMVASMIKKVDPTLDAQTGEISKPNYLNVKKVVQTFSPEEKQSIKAGKESEFLLDSKVKFFWDLAFAGTGLAAMYMGADSLQDLIQGESSNIPVDALVAVGAASLGAAAVYGAIKKDSTVNHLYHVSQKTVGYLLSPSRLSFWALFTLIGGTNTAAVTITRDVINGIENQDGYFMKMALRAYYAPWLNRGVYGVTGAMSAKPISMFRFLAPGYTAMYLYPTGQFQTGQTANQLYSSYAKRYSIASDEETRTVYLNMMSEIEDTLNVAIDNDGWGRIETISRANETLDQIAELKLEYNLPQ